MSRETFDQFAASYTETNDRFGRFFGEKTDYFAAYKAELIARRLGVSFSGKLLDVGCGIGLVTNRLRKLLPHAVVDGYDPSAESIAVAQRDAPTNGNYFCEKLPEASDYAAALLCNVLHHVPVGARKELVGQLAARTTTDGMLIAIEHNTWNPLVMQVLRHHPFDRDAVFVSFVECRKLFTEHDLEAELEFIVFFPSFLRFLRPLERKLRFVPFGAQYVCVGRKCPQGAGR